jgi:hypothetical protein
MSEERKTVSEIVKIVLDNPNYADAGKELHKYVNKHLNYRKDIIMQYRKLNKQDEKSKG